MAGKRVAIVQSNYIPWKGYFDLVASVDEFVLYDVVQYTRRDWRNRNRIKTPQGLKWMTVPVRVKGRYHQTILETEIDGHDWAGAHWTSLVQNYRRAAHFDEAARLLEPLYREAAATTRISELNRAFLEGVCAWLGIGTTIRSSLDYTLIEGRSERLANLCEQAGASVYVSGPAARNYLDECVFEKRGISVQWFEYVGYPEYAQLWGGFEHAVSIVDLLFNCGRDAPRYMKSSLR